MAKKTDNKQEDQKPKAEEKPKASEAAPGASVRSKWFGTIMAEMLQNAVLLILATAGLRRPGQGGDPQSGGVPEKQTPDWMMSIFPGLTRDDNNEYNLATDAHPDPSARLAAKKFRTMMRAEGVYDVEKYVVDLIKIWREFMERTKNPPPENKSGGRLNFEPVTINDSVKAFFTELRNEELAGGTEEQIYERQKLRAEERDLLPKKHALKKISENKIDAILYIVVGILAVYVYFALMSAYK